jgi:putative ABC transport system permease protein
VADSRRDWADDVRPRLARLRLTAAREAEIVEELSQHLDLRYHELRNDGADEAEAQRLAVDELLEPDALADGMRSLRQANTPPPIAPGAPRRSLVRDLSQDLRYAARMLTKERVLAAAVVLTLGLGIGANSAIFALVDAILLRPLPFPNADRLVMIWDKTEASARGRVDAANVADWNERSRTFEKIAAFTPNIGGMVTVGADGLAETIPRQWVSADVFEVLGIRPVAGRTFLRSDVARRVGVVVLSEAFWRARFNADPGVVGREIALDGSPHTIVGVVPQEAQLLGRTSIWALAWNRFHDSTPGARGGYISHAIGRLKPGVTVEAAASDLSAVAEGLAREFPKTNRGRGVTIDGLHDVVIGRELRQTSILFLAVVGVVLMICCANIANLLLARATSRRRELAMRSALGADRPRLVRQLLTESLLLSTIGGVVGILIGVAILRLAPSIVPLDLLSAAVTLSFDLRVLAFCAATALAVGVLFGLAPAWQATGFSSSEVIASDSRSVTGRGGRLRAAIVAGQIATAVVLVFGAGLLLRTLVNVETVDPGYRADSVLTMIVDPPWGDQTKLLHFYDAVERELRAHPTVRGVTWATTLPLGRSYQGPSYFDVVGAPVVDESRRPTADYQIVSPTYFQTVDLPVVMGRGFADTDTGSSVQVCMVNEAFVRGHLQGRSPIGARIAIRPTAAPQATPMVREIVGVARQVKGRPDETDDLLQIYVPLAQHTPGDIFMLITPWSGSAQALAPIVRAAFARIDKDQRVSVRTVMTLDDVASAATARYRFRAILVMAFAGLALVLAMVGVFGALAYSVEQRVRDFGVRRALGATTGDVLRLVIGSAARVIVAGAAIGLILSIAFGRLVATMLFGVQPLDPVTFGAVGIVLALTAAISIAGPAWRVTRIDPVVALRAE